MREIEGPALLWTKAALFVVLGLLAGGLIVVESPTLRTVALLAIAIWAFCRAYYFAFYVLERYVEPGSRFSGLGTLLLHLFRGRGEGTGGQ